MSKKSYKQLQNRLYREIKRRIIAEHTMRRPWPIDRQNRSLDCIGVRRIFRVNMEKSEYVQYEMACEIAKKLLEDKYIEFLYAQDIYDPVNTIEVMAKVRVVRPTR